MTCVKEVFNLDLCPEHVGQSRRVLIHGENIVDWNDRPDELHSTV